MMANEYTILKPKEQRSQDVLEELERIIKEDTSVKITPVRIKYGGIIVPLTRSKRLKALAPLKQESLKSVNKKISRAKRVATEKVANARIIAIIPTFEKEGDIDKTIISLLLQTRQIDQIIVVINGPGESDEAYQAILPFAREFRDQLIVERPYDLNGRYEDGTSKGSKVRALNWMYRRYIQLGDFDFVLGVDADVETDKNMVHDLEVDLIHRVKAAGVMARYSFKLPSVKDMDSKSLSLIYGQRHEFTVTGIRQQLRGYTSNILGGQATLFRAKALREAAQISDGGDPWDNDSLVEDAQLTRTFQKLGYKAATSAKARAWVGPMFTARSWQQQRRKWQDGHFTDMIRDFHPWIDRRRWVDQIGLGWNLISRVLFTVVLTTSIALNQFIFSPIWLTPIALAIIQSILVSTKVPNHTFREIIRAIAFIPGELYFLRTLSVWLDSMVISILNIRRDGWENQAQAEISTKHTAVSSWIIILAVTGGCTSLMFLANRWFDISPAINFMWWTLSVLTIGSSLSMLKFVFSIARNFRTIKP